MFIANGIWLIALGALAASGTIVAKRPDAKQLLDKLVPYQGWMGIVAGLWGIFAAIQVIANLSMIGSGIVGILNWVFFLALAVCLIALGSILGTGLAKTYVKEPKAQEKLDQLYNKLAPMRDSLGFAGIGIGIIFIILSILR